MSLSIALLAAGVVVAFALHELFSRKGPVWLGAVFPCLWIAGVVWAISAGRMENIRFYFVALLGLGWFLYRWMNGHQTRRATSAVEL